MPTSHAGLGLYSTSTSRWGGAWPMRTHAIEAEWRLVGIIFNSAVMVQLRIRTRARPHIHPALRPLTPRSMCSSGGPCKPRAAVQWGQLSRRAGAAAQRNGTGVFQGRGFKRAQGGSDTGVLFFSPRIILVYGLIGFYWG